MRRRDTSVECTDSDTSEDNACPSFCLCHYLLTLAYGAERPLAAVKKCSGAFAANPEHGESSCTNAGMQARWTGLPPSRRMVTDTPST